MIEPVKVLVADPPWPFKDKLGKRGAEANYKTQAIESIKAMGLPPLADDCHLFLWRVGSMQREALDVAEAWGFTIVSEIVWIKTTADELKIRMGMGRTVRNAHEICLVGKRGNPKVRSHSVLSVLECAQTFYRIGVEVEHGSLAAQVLTEWPGIEGPNLSFRAPRAEHSRKPDAFYRLVDELCDGPKFELYARRIWPGWMALGDEL